MSRLIFWITLVIALAIIPAWSLADSGAFIGKVAVEWTDDPSSPDRAMKLLESFEFVDENGTRWPVPAGVQIDGASIPKVFWTIIGPPFVGDYRRASVVYDYYCAVRSRPWREVHRMFYDASRAGGVDTALAKIMYAAVYAGGPRWETIQLGGETKTVSVSPPPYTQSELEELNSWINKHNPTLTEIEARLN